MHKTGQKPRRQKLRATKRFEEILRTKARDFSLSSKGWLICCPKHDDGKASCNVFSDTGVFFCFICGKFSPDEGLRLLGVPANEINEVLDGEQSLSVSSLERLDHEEDPKAKEAKFGVITERDWFPEWNFRDVRGALLTDSSKKIFKLFRPTFCRLWNKGRRQTFMRERYPRIAFHSPSGRIFLRLSSKQKIKVKNDDGLTRKNAVPFGLAGFTIPADAKAILLVEGPYDWLRTYQNLVDLGLEREVVPIALLGVSQWNAFLKVLEMRLMSSLETKTIILAFDNDEAGKLLTAKALEDLQKKLLLPKSQVRVLSYQEHDPGDTGKASLMNGLKKVGF